MGPVPRAGGPGGRNQIGTLIIAAVVALVGYEVVHNGRIGGDQIILFLVLIPSIILHEVSHGAVALMFGDDTAKRAGRLTLNPLRHVDPIGTLLIPGVLVLSGHSAFGYAKPVPVNVRRLRNPRDASLVVSLVGPAVNIVLALLAALLVRWNQSRIGFEPSLFWKIVIFLGEANVILAVFNLIPIPPLDGSAVIERLLPRAWWPGWLRIRQYSIVVVLFVVLIRPQWIDHLFNPALRWWAQIA